VRTSTPKLSAGNDDPMVSLSVSEYVALIESTPVGVKYY
jgi:hypothetical protein